MAFSEIAFEQFHIALEATAGTAVTTPTHLIHLGGVLTPRRNKRIAEHRSGMLAQNRRYVTTQTGADWETVSQDVDVNLLPLLLNVFVKGGVTSGVTVAGGTNSRLWDFTGSVTAADLKSFTAIWGDPNIQSFQSAFCVGSEMTLSCDATAEDGVLKATFKGMGQFPSKVSAPTPVASIAGEMLPAQMLQVWIDSASNIGTTAVTGRVLKTEHTFSTGVTPKYLGAGPTATLSYSAVGRAQRVGVVTKITMEVPDMTQYDQWAADTSLKVRVRYNGALIEGSLYNYVEVDTYGPFDALAWGDNQGSNRTVELTVNGFYDATLASDVRVAVQNARTGL